MTASAFSFQNVPPAPGRGEGPAPQTGQPAPEGGAPPAPPGGALGGLFPILIIIPMFLLMWWMNRGQQKKQKELEAKLKAGDQVVTQSGLIGKLTEKGERYAKLGIAPGIKVKILRSSVVGLDTGEEPQKGAPAGK